MRFRPTKGRVLIDPIAPESIVGSIVVPEAFQDKSSEGIVVALPVNNVVDVKIGDRVVVNRFQGTEVKISGRLYKMVEPKEILAVIE